MVCRHCCCLLLLQAWLAAASCCCTSAVLAVECPHPTPRRPPRPGLFPNTKSDLGPCEYEIHEDHLDWEAIQREYDELPAREKDR